MTKEYRSRWGCEPRADKRAPLVFTETDLELCKLLAHSAAVRRPWSYEYLPTGYFAPLLKRGRHSVPTRLRALSERPYAYITKPDQPRNNHRQLIYALDRNGADQLREAGCCVPAAQRRRLPHSLMACLIAASFEYATIENPSLSIDFDFSVPYSPIVPDWQRFRLTTATGSCIIYIEADLATETLRGRENDSTIDAKLVEYLDLMEKVPNLLPVFVTTRRTRMEGMIDVLKAVIDRLGLEHDYARQFAFTHITYDRFINTLPPLTSWAVMAPYQRAGFPPLILSDERNDG